MMNLEIFGKKDCLFCRKAKEFCEMMDLDYVYRDIEVYPEHKTRMFTLFPEAKTVPQIFDRGYHVGGYDELIRYNSERVFPEDRYIRLLGEIFMMSLDSEDPLVQRINEVASRVQEET